MSEHNALSFGVALTRAAARAVGLDETQGGLSRLSESVQLVGDFWDRKEWELLRGEIRFSRRITTPAVVARFSGFELQNLTANTILVRITRVENLTANIMQGALDTGTTVVANPVTTQGLPVDMRYPQFGPSSRLQIVSGDAAAGVTTIGWEWSGLTPQAHPEFILPPNAGGGGAGTKLFLLAATANLAQTMQFSWTERQPFPGELTARG